jgi:tetratricopeptide (TPR) repeat protein
VVAGNERREAPASQNDMRILKQIHVGIAVALCAFVVDAQTIEDDLRQAAAAYERGDYAQVIETASAAIGRSPSNAVLYGVRAMAHVMRRESAEALRDANEALRLDPKGAPAYMVRACAHFQAEQYSEALADYTEAIRLNYRPAKMYCDRGDVHAAAGDWQSAIRDYDKAVQLDANYATPHYRKSLVLYALGKYEQAVQSCGEALRLDPSLAEAHKIRGDAFFQMKEWEKAIEEFTEWLRLQPDNGLAYYSRGLARAKRNLPTAIDDFTTAIRLNAKLVEAHVQRAAAYEKGGKVEEAAADYRAAATLNGDNFEAYMGLSRLQAAARDYSQAVRHYNEAIRVKPSSSIAHCNRGFCRFQIGEWKAAIADVREAIRLDADHACAYNNLAWFLAVCPIGELRDGVQAITFARKACDLADWKAPFFLGTLAAAYAETGNFDEAVKWQQEAIEIGMPEEDLPAARHRLRRYQQGKPYRLSEKTSEVPEELSVEK